MGSAPEEVMAARAKLAQKFDAVRTGGKGTTRRPGRPAEPEPARPSPGEALKTLREKHQ